MEKPAIVFADQGAPTLLVLSIPSELSEQGQPLSVLLFQFYPDVVDFC